MLVDIVTAWSSSSSSSILELNIDEEIRQQVATE